MISLNEYTVLFIWILFITVFAIQAAAVITPIVCGIRTILKYKSSFFMGTALIVLGARLIFSITGSVPATMLMTRSVSAGSAELIVFSGIITNVLSTLLEIAVIVLFCMHFISRYKTGTANMIVAIIARIVSVFIGAVSNRTLASYLTNTTPAPVFISVRTLCIVVMAVSYISVIKLFMTAGEKEPERKKLFVFPLILMIYAVLSNSLNSVYTVFMSRNLNDLAELFMVTLPVVSSAAVLTGSIYIFMTAGKISAGNTAPDGKNTENIQEHLV